jgi:hypothetical protein
VCDEWLDALPVDHRVRAASTCERTGQEAAQEPAARRVHSDDAKLGVDAGELDLIRADEAGADEVNDVSPRDVSDEEELAGPPFEAAEFYRLALELGASVAELEDLRDRNEELSAGDAYDEPGDRWV